MPDILQLKEFFVTRLHVDWHGSNNALPQKPKVAEPVAFDYDVLRKEETPHSFVLRLRMKADLDASKSTARYEIDSEIMGFFDFPETMDEKQIQALIRVNGGIILYGILRGEIAAFTGSFPGGKIVLPAVYMQDIVAGIEERKRAAQTKEKQRPLKRKLGVVKKSST